MFDIYRKVPKDLTQPTYTGAIKLMSCTWMTQTKTVEVK